MSSPAFSDAPKPDELYRLGGWRLTAHARERMGDRGITVDQVAAVLRHPGTNLPSQKDDRTRVYTRDGVTLVVDEDARNVITVGIVGASGRDWEEHAAPLASAPLIEPEAPAPARAPQRRSRRHTAPVGAVTTTRVNQLLWQECLRRAGGDHRRLRILPDTGEVLILNNPA